jgi:ATP-dependent Clp protease ATP-binding subunit ClpA
MPTFSQSLEQSLHRALAIANERHHQYATLEHLLLSLIDDSGRRRRDARLQRRSRQAARQPRELSRNRI